MQGVRQCSSPRLISYLAAVFDFIIDPLICLFALYMRLFHFIADMSFYTYIIKKYNDLVSVFDNSANYFLARFDVATWQNLMNTKSAQVTWKLVKKGKSSDRKGEIYYKLDS